MGVAACGGGSQFGSAPRQEAMMKDEHVTGVDEFVRAFDSAWSRNDIEAAVALFAENATLESPLVQRVLHRPPGVLHGRNEIREMVRSLMSGGTPWGGHEPPLVRGNLLAIEFKAPSLDTDHFSVDIIELKDGKIQSLRAYVGWRALTPQPPGGHRESP